MIFAEIVFPQSPTSFTFASEMENLAVGDLVTAPLRAKVLNGVVVAISKTKPDFATRKIDKNVRSEILTAEQVELAKFIREYYAAHFGKVLKLFLPNRIWSDEPSKRKSKTTEILASEQPVKKLTATQEKVLGKILKTKKPILLHGITGSGKTEIYLRVILEILKKGKSAILLVPEIALTPQLVGYFAATIPKNEIAVLHSNLSEGEKLNSWERIYAGEVRLVIGSRSALFAPVRNLGVIILDEEHEWNYKNDQTPRYHARGVAMKLAEISGAKLILGSATPSLESYFFAKEKRIALLELPDRIGEAKLPVVRIVDLRNELKRENFSPFSQILKKKIREKLEKKEQIILLLNKRGFASSVVCRECGFVLNCENCSLPLTFHSKINRCLCHGCGAWKLPPAKCPSCKSVAIRFLGTGTQKIETELPRLFPEARILRADRDTTSLRGAHQKIYGEFRSGAADILIGTQIVAKGLDLPNVSLVGVLLADIGLHLPDFRAAEKTFSLLTQVAGRAGRGGKIGEVVIQTYSPDHPALVAAQKHDYQKFFAEEILERKNSYWPPFSKVVKFIFVDESENVARRAAENFAAELRKIGEKKIWIAPALIARLHNKFHFHVIWKGGDPRKLLAKIPSLEGVRVDVDPVNLG
ncbi:primosomal protein N' [Candidatus Gracilibacteria bacterium]|nr:primosomal protein N' [Candidatus Gracilibacteria bacterium]MCF7856268.1 primosomal protein N' [Candidatus Gracilibacteria bacterium]MCF7896253.1 primosomal protein N' [Candidatus Gracilibacteria bacterium]